MNASSIVKALREQSGKKRRLLEIIVIVAVALGVQWFQTRGLPEGAAPPLAGMRSDGVVVALATRVGVGGTAEGALTANTVTAVKETQRPVLVVFWSTWCPVCKLEEGNITRVAERWPVLSVAMQSGDAATVSRHLQERNVALPALIDARGDQAMAWQVQGVPTHFIVDTSGQIRFRVVGYATTLGLMARLWWAEHVSS